MHDTCFGDLENLRIGATGYVYCHQGCCEHALYFKDIRRIHPDDPQQASAYPVQTFQVPKIIHMQGSAGSITESPLRKPHCFPSDKMTVFRLHFDT